jgi:EAL domain-containing protein (putative c-di-GMP-specific phosphodiesterase class I)
LLRDADTAMHAAKSHGRGRHHTFDAGLRHDATARLTLENALRDALGRDELRVVYQPKVDLITNGWVGVEALLRWDHPTLGAVPPDVFVPVAEETGLIHPLGQFVLEQACRQSAAWRRDGIDLTVAVNISGQQLVDPLLADRITAVLAEAGLTPDRLCLELTESVLMSHAERTARTLAHIHRLGVQLSIDDFGTGYSSLSYLQRFPVDELKIDRVFVNDLTAHPEQRTLITAMVAMGQALGLSIVAEGVETIEQAHGLRVLGCNSAQGYLFAAPQPANTLEPILKERAQVMLP